MARHPGFHEETADSLGQWLRRERNKRGLTQKEIASKLGVSQSFYSKMERGKIPLHIVEDLSRVFGIEKDTLMIAIRRRNETLKQNDVSVCYEVTVSELEELVKIARATGRSLSIATIYSLTQTMRKGTKTATPPSN